MILLAFIFTLIAVGKSFSNDSLPDYTIYAACTDRLSVKISHKFFYGGGSYYNDSFVGVSYTTTDYFDVFIRADQTLIYEYSVFVPGFYLLSTELSENFLAVSGYNLTSNLGDVFIYSLNVDGIWSYHSTLTQPVLRSSVFGHSMSISNDKLVVGDGDYHSLYMYELVSGEWTYASTLTISYVGYLGQAVAISGSEVLVTIDTDAHGINEIYSFRYDQAVWTFMYKLSGDYTNGYSATYPNRLQVHGNLLVYGQQGYNNGYDNRGYLFAHRNGTWQYQSEFKLTRDEDSVGIIATSVKDDALLVISNIKVWEYTLGPDGKSMCNTEKYQNMPMILGISIGGGGAVLLCMVCFVYFRYVRAAKYAGKVNPATASGDEKIDGYLGGDVAEVKTKPSQTMGVQQELMYVC